MLKIAHAACFCHPERLLLIEPVETGPKDLVI